MRETIAVYTQDLNGRWQRTGLIRGPQDGDGGGFIYAKDYHGPSLAPQLDYTAREPDGVGGERVFLLPGELIDGPQSRTDLHSVFESALPGKAGRQVIAMRSPGFLKLSPFEQLATLAALGDWRSGGMMFVRSSEGLDFRATPGLEALSALNDEINRKVLEITERGGIPTGTTIGRPEDQWALATNRSEAFTVEVCHNGQFWVAGAAREIMESEQEGRLEAGLLKASEMSGIPTVDRLLYEPTNGHGEALLLTKRSDTVALPPLDNAGDLDDEDNVPSLRTHKISMFVALDVTERTQLDYVDMARFLEVNSAQPDTDVRDLYSRMMLNAFSEVSNDHLGQFELLQRGDRWNLAPSHGLMIDDPDHQRPHALKMAGTARPEFSVEWIDRCSKAFGLPREEGREIASKVLREVARLPEYWRAYGMSEEMLARVSKYTQTGLHQTLRNKLEGTLDSGMDWTPSSSPSKSMRMG